MMLNKRSAAFLMGFAALCWATNGICINKADYLLIETAFARVSIASLFFFAIRFGFFKAKFNVDTLKLQLIAAFFFIVSILFWIAAVKDPETHVATATVLIYTYPFVTMLLKRVFEGEKVPAGNWVLLVISLAGAKLVAGGLNFSFESGKIWALVAGLIWGIHLFFVKKLKRKEDSVSAVGIGLLLGVFIFPLISVSGIMNVTFYWPSGEQLLWLILLGIGSGIAFGIYACVATILSATALGMIGILEVLFAVPFAAGALGEKLGSNTLIGGSIMLVAAAVLICRQNGNSK